MLAVFAQHATICTICKQCCQAYTPVSVIMELLSSSCPLLEGVAETASFCLSVQAVCYMEQGAEAMSDVSGRATGANRCETGQTQRATRSGMQGGWLADNPTLCALTGKPYGYSCMSGRAETGAMWRKSSSALFDTLRCFCFGCMFLLTQMLTFAPSCSSQQSGTLQSQHNWHDELMIL